ncbi:unnamed protein product [Vitrella brassicaformis CCMP3155]|uniref:Uncharacterized protein n=1 Tax=Vitrella brassicaformis (strain CCMP3155) TaxID=1169540 RepID=A0A0G4H2Z8_VITBC|nr:unnamed protein product [Vitrella brassicaformis CCMP3155]|eukprot:CEM38074.1 unnamed protein product [Vitrella brassicaformis CCMP3155]
MRGRCRVLCWLWFGTYDRVFANRVYIVSGRVDARSLNRAELTPEQQLSQTSDTYEKFKGVQIRTYERKDDD